MHIIKDELISHYGFSNIVERRKFAPGYEQSSWQLVSLSLSLFLSFLPGATFSRCEIIDAFLHRDDPTKRARMYGSNTYEGEAVNINAALRDVTDRMSVVVGWGQKERRRSSRAVECSKSRIHPRDDNNHDDDGVGRNLSCNADYGEHYLLIANPMMCARAHARVYMCECHRYEGVAWRSAMLERAQQHDESWNESLMPPPPPSVPLSTPG